MKTADILFCSLIIFNFLLFVNIIFRLYLYGAYYELIYPLIYERFDKRSSKIPRKWRKVRLGEKLPEQPYFYRSKHGNSLWSKSDRRCGIRVQDYLWDEFNFIIRK